MPRPHLALTAGILLLAISAATPALAQGLNAVYSKDGVDVWAVGEQGQIRRSLNGGASWIESTLGPAGRTHRGVAAQGLTVIAVGDSGKIWRSLDNGGNFGLTVIPGAPVLHAIEMPTALVGYVVGAGETICKTIDGGANWTVQKSGGSNALLSVRFRDAQDGWAVGAAGLAFHTTNGGANWSPVVVPTINNLYSVDFLGSDVWAVGGFGTAYKSANSGGLWTPVDLKMEAPVDVRAVSMASATQITLTGGGGFIRTSNDGGATWTFATHSMLKPTSDYFAYGAGQAWVTSLTSPLVERTSNGGTTWSLPTSTTTLYDWQWKQTAGFYTIRGNTFATSPKARDHVWAVMGPVVYKSRDRGETWTAIDTIPSCSKTNSFYVSPKDTNTWIAAVGSTDRIAKTINGGATWSTVLSRDFTEYGMPLEMHPDKTDTLFFGPEDGKIYRIKGWGTSFDTLSTPVPPFRSPCDIVITPGNDSNVLVGDGVTGLDFAKIFQSENGGVSWTERYTGASSETPTLWTSRLGSTTVFATNWSGGGVWRSLNSGKDWSQVTSISSAWGGSTATDDPKLVTYNRYAGSPNYVSFDGGTAFTSMNLTNPGSGYAVFAMDRSTLLDMHSQGIYKLAVSYTVPAAAAPAVAVTAPNGGESWTAGSVRTVTWTATNLALVRIEYRKVPTDPWQTVTELEGYLGSYAWTVPPDPTDQAKIRVVDAWDSSPADESNGTFTILAPELTVNAASLAFGDHPVGSSTTDTLRIENTGTATLNVSSIATATSIFHPGRTTLTLAPGAADTIGVTFVPAAGQAYADTVVLLSNGGAAVRVALSGAGISSPMLQVASPGGGEDLQYGHSYPIAWQSAVVSEVAIDYRTADNQAWIEIVSGVPASEGSYAWVVPNAPTSTARVRVREVGDKLQDVSDLFDIVVPSFLAFPVPLDMGSTPAGQRLSDTLRIGNTGTALLTITNVTSDNPKFWPSRTSLTVPVSQSDTLGVQFQPNSLGPDSALFTLTADDPTGTHVLRVRGEGIAAVSAGSDLPKSFALYSNQPNPFRGSTVLRFALPVRAPVTLEIFNLQGQRVTTLLRGEQEPGVHSIVFRPGAQNDVSGQEAIASGVYFVRFAAPGFSSTRKILYMAP